MALASLGWALVLRARLAGVARAEHELRGGLAAVALGAAAVGRHAGPWARDALDVPLARARAGLEQLQTAQRGRRDAGPRRPLRLDRLVGASAAGYREAAGREGRVLSVRWRAGNARVAADPRAVSSALGNVMANAVEHGRGDIELRGRRAGDRVRLEVLNGGSPGNGRGLGMGIARRAARRAGGSLELRADGDRTAAVIEFPVAE